MSKYLRFLCCNHAGNGGLIGQELTVMALGSKQGAPLELTFMTIECHDNLHTFNFETSAKCISDTLPS